MTKLNTVAKLNTVIACAAVAALAFAADACTAFVVGKKASATGRVIVGHNNDGFGPMKYAILSATDSAPELKEPGRTGGLGGGKSPTMYWHAVYSDKARSGKATGDVLLNEYGVMMFSNSGGFMREWGGRTSELPDEAEAETEALAAIRAQDPVIMAKKRRVRATSGIAAAMAVLLAFVFQFPNGRLQNRMMLACPKCVSDMNQIMAEGLSCYVSRYSR